MKKLLIAAASVATLAAPIAATAQPVYHGDYHRDHADAGAAVAAGLFGFVLGAALSSSQHDYDHAGYGYGYGYGYERPPYTVRCHWETRAYRGPRGRVNYQQVQVCR